MPSEYLKYSCTFHCITDISIFHHTNIFRSDWIIPRARGRQEKELFIISRPSMSLILILFADGVLHPRKIESLRRMLIQSRSNSSISLCHGFRLRKPLPISKNIVRKISTAYSKKIFRFMNVRESFAPRTFTSLHISNTNERENRYAASCRQSANINWHIEKFFGKNCSDAISYNPHSWNVTRLSANISARYLRSFYFDFQCLLMILDIPNIITKLSRPIMEKDSSMFQAAISTFNFIITWIRNSNPAVIWYS